MIKNIRLVMAALALLCFCVTAEVFCQPVGNLQVTLLPAAAISAGAKWRVVGEATWHASGESITYAVDNYPAGCTLEFASLAGWLTPQTRTIVVPDSDTAATIATYMQMTTTVADSQADFSATQGYNNWQYGHWPNTNHTFKQYTTYSSNGTNMMWSGGDGTWCTLYSYGGHPELANETVRRWTSTINRPAVISGNIYKMPGSNAGNGIIGSIYVGGVKKYTIAIGWDWYAATPYAFNTNISSGGAVDFALNSNGDPDSDHIGFTSIIKVAISTGSLRVNIQPSAAVALGAKWRRVGTTPWFGSGEVEYDIPVGTYTIELSDLSGWSKPAAQSITVVDNQLNDISYAYPNGSLHVTIQPSGAIAAGAQWRRVGTTQWFASGATESFVPIGSYSVEFSAITPLGTPAAQAVTIASGQTSEVIGTYWQGGLVKIDILPVLAVMHKAQWRPVGTTKWLNSGDSERVPVGDCTIEFKPVKGWREAMTRTLTIAWDKMTEKSATYHGGYVVAWGNNAYGQCSLPKPNSEYVAVSTSHINSLALRSDGSIFVSGAGNFGQCYVPYPNSDFVAVASGLYNSLGLKSNGSIVGWGWNEYGQCNAPSPNSDFVAVAGGDYHSLGLKSDGSVVGWGLNTSGEYTLPSPNSGYKEVVAGMKVSLLLRNDGSIVALGSNMNGLLNLPTPNSGFEAVAISEYHALGLKSDRSVVGWGWNDNGQLNVPAPNSDFVAISTGRLHSIGLKSDGSIVGWGWNDHGQCNIPSPNSGYVAISTGTSFAHNLALKLNEYGSLRVTTTPSEGKWRRVGTSTWFASGETEYDVMVNTHSVEFIDLAGWTKPSPILVHTNNPATAAYTPPATVTLPQAKNYPDGTAVRISGLAVSAAWPDVFYIQTDSRAMGIRVEKVANGLVYGNLADVVGIISTNTNGERFIQASTAAKIETENNYVKPLGMTNKLIGGSSLIGQLGVLNGSGLNNIGLLVRTWGNIIEREPVTAPAIATWFKIDDGSGAQIKCIVPTGVTINPAWNYVLVTGVSSCEKVGADLIRLILIPTINDITSK